MDEMGKQELQIFYELDDLKRIDHLLSGNARLSYAISSQLETALSLARGSRLASVSEAYGYYLYNPEDGYLHLGNPNLPNETSIQLEWQNSWMRRGSRVDVNLYVYELSHYIFSDIIPGESLGYAFGWKQYVDAGNASIQGLEVSSIHEVNSRLRVQGGLSYEEARLTDRKDNLPQIPPLTGHGSLTFQARSFWLQGEVKGSAGQYRVSEAAGENPTPAFWVMNLKGEIDLWAGMGLNLGVRNLTNQLYYEHLDWGDIYRPGRSYYIAIALDDGLFNQ